MCPSGRPHPCSAAAPLRVKRLEQLSSLLFGLGPGDESFGSTFAIVTSNLMAATEPKEMWVAINAESLAHILVLFAVELPEFQLIRHERLDFLRGLVKVWLQLSTMRTVGHHEVDKC